MVFSKVLVLTAALVLVMVGLRAWRRPPRVARVEPSSIGASGAAIVQFGTAHCAPCKQARPVLEAAARAAGVEFVDVDLDERPDLASRYGIRSVPLILVTDPRGGVLGRWTGVPRGDELQRLAELARAA